MNALPKARPDPTAVSAGLPTSPTPTANPRVVSAKNARPKGSPETTEASAENGTRPPRGLPNPTTATAGGFLELRVFAEMFADVQALRISNENRVRSAQVESALLTEQVALDDAREFAARKAMIACFKRTTPLYYSWAKDTPGIGESTLARLLGCIGHPCIATPHHWEGEGSKRVLIADEPYVRTVGQLWSYCGHGDPLRKKRAGMTAEEAFALGSPHAKMIVHLLAEACMKAVGSPANADPNSILGTPVSADPDSQPIVAPDTIRKAAADASDDEAIVATTTRTQAPRRRSPYRDTYDQARARYLDRTHATDCVRCGPSGKPALAGTPWSDGHQHAAALRLVGKEILRDLWLIGHEVNA